MTPQKDKKYYISAVGRYYGGGRHTGEQASGAWGIVYEFTNFEPEPGEPQFPCQTFWFFEADISRELP